MARAQWLESPGFLPSWGSLPMQCLQGRASHNGSGPLATETGSPALSVFAAYGSPTEDGSPQRYGPFGRGGRGFLPSRWSLPMEGLQGITPPNRAGLLARGTESRAESLVATYAPPTGENPQRRGPTGLGDTAPCPAVRGLLLSGCVGWQPGPQAARAHCRRGRGVLPNRWSLPVERLWRSNPQRH